MTQGMHRRHWWRRYKQIHPLTVKDRIGIVLRSGVLRRAWSLVTTEDAGKAIETLNGNLQSQASWKTFTRPCF